MYDSIIIGSGPAGVTASLYMVRAGLKVLIISKNKSALDKAELIENYYGFENGISGKELNNIGIKQAKNLGVEFLIKEVTSIKYSENGYEVISVEKAEDGSDFDESIKAFTKGYPGVYKKLMNGNEGREESIRKYFRLSDIY